MAPCSVCGAPRTLRTLRLRGPVRTAVLLGPFVVAALVGAPLLHDLVEGVDRTRLPLWRAGIVLVAVLGCMVAALVRLRRPTCARCSRGALLAIVPDGQRRAVLRAMGAAGAATVSGIAGLLFPNRRWVPVARAFVATKVETQAPSPNPVWHGARVRGYRRLGRTNAVVSDISLGSSRIRDVAVPRALFERGVTYVDTAPDYADAGSERLLGQAMRGYRDRVFLATKFCRPTGHLPNDTPAAP